MKIFFFRSIRLLGLFLCVFFYPLYGGNSQLNYFSDLKLYSAEELVEELKQKALEMCWHFGQNSHFRFKSSSEEVYFEVCLGALPDIYEDFVARVRHQFIKNENEQLIFSYQLTNDGNEEINQLQPVLKKEHPEEYSYIITDRRIIENGHPQDLSQEELIPIIRDKNVLFYSGAGLSRASHVPAMSELNELLGLVMGKKFLFSLESALKNPREFALKIRKFHEACFLSAPTQAHLALKDLAIFKNIRILTENLDTLHEASGIYPYRIDPDHVRNEIGEETLRQFDYIICIGLSYDDRGFLGWYKKRNPQGKIIAIDLNQPSYLGDEDFLVKGDVQAIIPDVQKMISQEK